MSFRTTPVRIAKNSAPILCPPDKSVTHRAFLFSLFSSGRSVIKNPLFGEDCLASLESVRRLGADVKRAGDMVEINGFGIGQFKGSTDPKNPTLLDCQNSGTTMRLLSGILAGQSSYFKLFGDASLSGRPMGRVSEPLRQMGASVFPRGEKKGSPTPPIDIEPAHAGLKAIQYRSKVASAQVKSAVLLAGLWCGQSELTSVAEPSLSRDHTERMLRGMGISVESHIKAEGVALASLKGQRGVDFQPLNVTIGGDPSSAAFWACASVMQDRDITIENVLLNPTRLGFVETLKRMGANIKLVRERTEGGEEIGLVEIKAGASLRAAEVAPYEVPTLVDEVPMLAIAALWAKGTSVFRGVQELRVKESDRLEAIIQFITSIGGKAWAVDNDLHVEGLEGAPRGTETRGEWAYKTLGDHRLAMASVITADALQREIVLDDAECIKVSYPSFFEHRENLG